MEYNLVITPDNQYEVGLEKATEYNVDLENPSFNIYSITEVVEAEWGNINGNITDQKDLKETLDVIDSRLEVLESKPSDVISLSNYMLFPNIGSENVLYLDEESNLSYRWDSENFKYYKINDFEEINEINGGSANGK